MKCVYLILVMTTYGDVFAAYRDQTPMDRVERELQNLSRSMDRISKNERYKEYSINSKIADIERHLGDRLNVIERILTQHNENIGDTEVQKARLRHQITVLRSAIRFYENNQLADGHCLLRESLLSDAQLRHYCNQACSIEPYTVEFNFNGTRIYCGIGVATLGLLSFIRNSSFISFEEFDWTSWAFFGLAEITGLFLISSGITRTERPNSISPILLDQIEHYLTALEAALDKN